MRPHAARQEPPRAHDPRTAARRDQRDHAVQPSDEPGRAQDRAFGCVEQPDGAQTLGEGAAVGVLSRGPALRGGVAARDARGGHGRPARDRHRDDHERARRTRHLHRRGVDRQGDRVKGGLPQDRPRTGRERPADRDGGRRSRRGLDARGAGLLQEFGPALHGDQAHARARVGRRGVHRARRRQDARVELRRPVRRERRNGHRDRREGGAAVRGARERGGREGRAPPGGQRAPRRAVFADRARSRRPGNDAGARGNLRPGLADHRVSRHRRRDPHLQRHGLRPVVGGVHESARLHHAFRARSCTWAR